MLRVIQFSISRATFLFVLFCIGVFVCACSSSDTQNDMEDNTGKVVKVGDEILYEKDVEGVVKKEDGADRTALRERFINNWIRKELLLQVAKMNLSEEEQNVEEQVKDYRASLLINQYKQKYLAEHLDTLVTEEEIELYVKEYADNFILKESLYQYYLAKVLTKNTQDIQFIRNLFSRTNINLMQDFNLQSSTVISNYDTDWYLMKDILSGLPASTTKEDLKNLKVGQVFVTKDSTATYLLRPIHIVKAGEMSPSSYINTKVREIILHNRKITLAKKLEYEIYEDAKKKNKIEIY